MRKAMVIGLDGFEPSLARQWMAEGRLPNLAALARRGSFMPCRSTIPHATFPAWTTCVTGVNPGRHGITDFTTLREGAYGIRFLNAADRRAPALWNIVTSAGGRVGVLGVPATYPPEPVNGFLVAGFDSPVTQSVDQSFVYPTAFYPRVRDWRFADFQETNIGPGWHFRALPKLLEGIATKERIALDLLHTESPAFFMLVFGESDTVSPHFWLFHDRDSPRHRPGHEDAIRRVYKRLDEAVGRLRDAAHDDTFLIVVSDHGFGGAGTGVVHLNNWLAAHGYLAFDETAPGGSVLKHVAMAAVPDAWKGPLFRKLRGMAQRAESASRFGGIDWAQTRAYSEELNYYPSIRINLKGREPGGTVEPADYNPLMAELCAKLETWECVDRAYPRSAVYDGPATARAPDIILDLAMEGGYSHSCLRARGGSFFRRIRPEEALGGKEHGMNGNHRPYGVCFTSEPVAANACSLYDIAPTVLAAMGVTAPPMEGRSLIGAGEHGEAMPFRHQYKAYSAEEETALEERLRALGYLE